MPVAPPAVRFDDALGKFTLPYTVVRTADDPDAVLLELLQSTYEAAAERADRYRTSLERTS